MQSLVRQEKMMSCRSELQASCYTWYWPIQALVFYATLLLLGSAMLSGSLLCVVLAWVLPHHAGVRLGRWLISMLFRVYLGLLCSLRLMRLDIKALDQLNAEHGLVIAPNHPTMLDALLVVSRVPQTCCIMKAQLWDNIFLGAGARLAAYIRNDSMDSMIRLSAAELRSGSKLLMFPEGTRTEHPPINPLKGGIALIAKIVPAPIQTVIIETNTPYISKNWHLLKAPPFPMIHRARLGRRFDAVQKVQQTLDSMQHYYEQELGPIATRVGHDAS
jgi:1-acyl-sn-glycerol-3-phosphate acyltransferase